jgi:phage terminase large subunit-like protein
MPEERAEQHKLTDRVQYLVWAKKGYCTLTPGNVVDYDAVESHMMDREMDQGWKVRDICYDPYNAEYYTQKMEQKGYVRFEVRQGAPTLSEPTKRLREMIMQGSVVFEENELLLWCFSNAIEENKDNECIKLSKKHKNDSQRIDLVAAIVNALVLALAEEQASSAYEDHGIILL